MSVSKQTSTAIMMNTNNSSNDIDKNRILANNKAKRAKIASENALNNMNHQKIASNSNTTNNANQQRRARFLNSNNHNNSNDEMEEDSMGSTVMQPPLPPSTYPTTVGGMPPAPSKRTTSLPPGSQQPANGGKNVVYLNLKNRAIKSDSAYSVSQLIKVITN